MKMTAEEINAFIQRAFPQVAGELEAVSITADETVMRLLVGEQHLRPGGTVSGPSIFALADVSIYAAILSAIGPKALAVTTNCSIDFMRKPEAGRNLLAYARLLKLGKSLAVGDVLIRPEGDYTVLARASLTYAIPPAGSSADVDG